MKKFLSAILALLIVLSLTGCGGPINKTPKGAVVGFVEKVKDMDITGAMDYQLNGYDVSLDELSLSKDVKVICSKLLKNVKYEIVSIDENDSLAIVNIKISNRDFEPVIEKMYEISQTNEIINYFNPLDFTGSQVIKGVKKLFEKCCAVVPTTMSISHCKVEVLLTEGRWYIVDPSEIFKCILGGLEDVNLDGIF